MPPREVPLITPDQLQRLRNRKQLSTLHYRDVVEVLGTSFPLATAVTRDLFPPELRPDMRQLCTSQELFFAELRDLVQEFLDGLSREIIRRQPAEPAGADPARMEIVSMNTFPDPADEPTAPPPPEEKAPEEEPEGEQDVEPPAEPQE